MSVNEENKRIWNSNSASWNKRMGEHGNDWHNKLIAPHTELLLDLGPGETLLDVACGNGLFARRMARNGIHVLAFDFSPENIELAKTYDTDKIDYRILDATSTEDMTTLHDHAFDAAVANMALMDMPEIKELFNAVYRALTPGGVFVFSIQHPAFNSNYTLPQQNGALLTTNYITLETYKGRAIKDQPIEQFYFHRPISFYTECGLDCGFVIDGFIEPTFHDEEHTTYSRFPPVLIIRLRKAK